MRKIHTRRLAVCSTAVAILAAGCGTSGAGPQPRPLSDAATIEYIFQDSSVPPEYHRSYVMTITKGNVRIVVDSYGDLINEADRPLPDQVWGELLDGADRLADFRSGVDEACDGGTASGVRIEDGGETVVDVESASCGGEGSEELEQYIEPVIESVDDFEALLDRP
jgi:hypothetical protein